MTATNDLPIIGWRNIVTTSAVMADTSSANFPVTNVANPATFLTWKAGDFTSTQYITITDPGVSPIDYVAIAAHNLFSASVTVTIEYDATGSPAWTPLTTPAIPASDNPIIYRFNSVTTTGIRIKLEYGISPPELAQIGVVYAGALLVLERGIYAGHTPITQGRTWNATNGMSESGQFLGRIVTREFNKTKIPLQLLTPAWYRANLDPFLAAAAETPFFFSWRPATYPLEAGYGWLINIPAPVPSPPSNLIALDLEVTGIA